MEKRLAGRRDKDACRARMTTMTEFIDGDGLVMLEGANHRGVGRVRPVRGRDGRTAGPPVE